MTCLKHRLLAILTVVCLLWQCNTARQESTTHAALVITYVVVSTLLPATVVSAGNLILMGQTQEGYLYAASGAYEQALAEHQWHKASQATVSQLLDSAPTMENITRRIARVSYWQGSQVDLGNAPQGCWQSVTNHGPLHYEAISWSPNAAKMVSLGLCRWNGGDDVCQPNLTKTSQECVDAARIWQGNTLLAEFDLTEPLPAETAKSSTIQNCTPEPDDDPGASEGEVAIAKRIARTIRLFNDQAAFVVLCSDQAWHRILAHLRKQHGISLAGGRGVSLKALDATTNSTNIRDSNNIDLIESSLLNCNELKSTNIDFSEFESIGSLDHIIAPLKNSQGIKIARMTDPKQIATFQRNGLYYRFSNEVIHDGSYIQCPL